MNHCHHCNHDKVNHGSRNGCSVCKNVCIEAYDKFWETPELADMQFDKKGLAKNKELKLWQHWIKNQHFSSMEYLPQHLAGEFESDRQIDIEILIGLASLVPEGLSTSHGRKEIHFLSISDQITMTNRSIIVY